jgi:hypothetical protein
MKIPYLTYRFWCRPILDGLNFLLVHLDTLRGYDIAKKHNFNDIGYGGFKDETIGHREGFQ